MIIIEDGGATETIKQRLNDNASKRKELRKPRLLSLKINNPIFTEDIVPTTDRILKPEGKRQKNKELFSGDRVKDFMYIRDDV